MTEKLTLEIEQWTILIEQLGGTSSRTSDKGFLSEAADIKELNQLFPVKDTYGGGAKLLLNQNGLYEMFLNEEIILGIRYELNRQTTHS